MTKVQKLTLLLHPSSLAVLALILITLGAGLLCGIAPALIVAGGMIWLDVLLARLTARRE